MSEYAVAAMGADRPGIVAAASEALVAAGASIEDSSMTILGGHFAMLLVVHGELDLPALQAALDPVAARFELLLEVRPAVEHPAVAGIQRDDYVIAAYGADRPGLVASLARVLADADANIADFGSRLTSSGVFNMWFNVTLPSGTDVGELTERLGAAGGAVELDVSIHQAEVEAL
jgi:glycine cleavage system transcriptional repressor